MPMTAIAPTAIPMIAPMPKPKPAKPFLATSILMTAMFLPEPKSKIKSMPPTWRAGRVTFLPHPKSTYSTLTNEVPVAA